MSGYLCEELVDDIFERLPVKSLLRFRSISKYWCSRIDSHDFIRMHTNRSLKNQRQNLLVIYKNSNITKNIKDMYKLHSVDQLPLGEERGNMDMSGVKFPSGELDIVGSCNGVFCLLGYENEITLWNPSVRRKLTILEPSLFKDTINGEHVIVGFGYDTNTDDYKIMRISYFKHVQGIGNEYPMIYSMKTGAWCAIPSFPTTSFYDVVSQACFFNGTLHWVVKSYSCQRYIMTFDLSCELFGTIALPEPNQVTRQLTIINGSLAVISNEGNNSWIWVRKENKHTTTTWSRLFKVNGLLFDGRVVSVLQLTNGDFLFNTYCERFKGFKLFNLSTGELERRLVELMSSSDKVDMETYVESLLLLDIGSPCDQPKQRKKNRKRKMRALLSYDENSD